MNNHEKMLHLQQQIKTAAKTKSKAVFLKSLKKIMKNKIDSHAAMHGCVVKTKRHQISLG